MGLLLLKKFLFLSTDKNFCMYALPAVVTYHTWKSF